MKNTTISTILLDKLLLDGVGEPYNSIPVCCIQSLKCVDKTGSLRPMIMYWKADDIIIYFILVGDY